MGFLSVPGGANGVATKAGLSVAGRTAFTPRSISGLALWLDASASGDLYTTDAGPVVPVSSPTEISGCVGWYDSSDLSAMRQNSDGTGAVAAGDPVGWWRDKSATGAHVTGTGTARPTLSATGFNSRQSLVFNGSSTNLSCANYTAQDNLTGLTRIAVAAQTVNQPGWLTRVWSGAANGITANGGLRVYANTSGANFVNFQVPGMAGSAVPAGIYSSVYANSAVSLNANGAGVAGAITGTIAANTGTGTSTLHMGSNIGANEFWIGPIAEYIVFNRALTAAELARVEAYLAQRWGISGVHAAATSANDPVGYWRDRSGNGRHAVQATGGRRATVGSSAINGRRAISFGTASNSQQLGWLPSSGTQDWREVIAVGVYDLAASTFPDFAGLFTGFNSNAGSGLGIGLMGDSGANQFSTSFGTFLPEANINAVGHVATSTVRPFPAITSPFVVVSRAGSPNIPVTVAGYTVGFDRQFASSGRNWRGRLAEVIAFERFLTAAERNRIVRYLASKYGITLAPQVSNADAQDWINRVYANGGTVSAATAAAVNQFCIDIENAPGGSIRDRFYRLNLFCGGTSGTAVGLNSALVPLYRGPSLGGTQFGNAVDTNQGPFAAGAYAEASGLTPLLAGGHYLDTGLTPDAMPLSVVQAMHISASHGPIPSPPSPTGGYFIGAANGATDRHFIQWNANSSAAVTYFSPLGKTNSVASASIAAGSQPSAIWVSSRTSATSLVLYKNGVSDGTLTTSVTGIASYARAFTVCRCNFTGTIVGDSYNFPHRHYSIGAGLSGAEVVAYNNALSAFFSAIGRTA